jgi:hypothetical protein
MKSKKSRKPKKSRKTKKIRLDLFQEVRFKPKSLEMAVLVLVCAIVFGVSSLASGKLLHNYDQEKIKNTLNSTPEIKIVKSAVAAESDAEDAALKEKNDAEAAAMETALAKEKADKIAKAKMAARQRAAETARILSGPVPTGKTSGLPDGRRECTTKSLHPQRGGKVHVDEDCCADYNETPNPRCYYPPSKMAILKH